MQIIFNDEQYSWNNTSLEDFLHKHQHTPSRWMDFFNKPIIDDQIHTISNFLKYEASQSITIYPNINNVFQSLYLTNPTTITTIIIGQDPYHDGAATGIAFDVPPGKKINPSLRNIKTEVLNSGYSDNPELSTWPEQGVLLINTALTVEKGSPQSHTEIWNEFTNELIQYIVNQTQKKRLVWLLMGSHAHSYAKNIPNRHIIIKTTHPSPLSAYKSTTKTQAFIGSCCFKTINEELAKIGHKKIKF